MKITVYHNQYGFHDIYFDKEDYDIVSKYKWHIYKSYNCFYAHAKSKHSLILMHQLIIGKSDKYIDHINGNGLDNRKCNLRVCTNTQNQQNARKRKDNTTGFKGVDYHKRSKKYRARIRVNKIQRFLGDYDTPQEAYKAYCEASKRYHGEFSRLK